MEIGTYFDQSTQKKISVWELKKHVGMGGMTKGPIKEAKLQDENGKTIDGAAIKYLFLSNNEEIKKSMIREYEVMETSNHENVVKLYTKFIDKNIVTIVMELCQSDLYEYMQTRVLPETEIKSLFNQMLNGLAYLHSNKILHRDIKPSNILIKNSSIIKLADFGISKITEATQNTSVGTQGYTAPEVLIIDPLTGFAHFSKPADIFSLGVSLYYMYARKNPWTLNFSKVLYPQQILDHYKERLENDNTIFEFDRIVQIREDAKDLIQKMLCFDPKKRITLTEILNHPYMKYSQDLSGYFKEKIHQFIEEYSQDLPAFFKEKIQYIDALNMSVEIIYNFHHFCEDIQLFHQVLILMVDEIHNKTSKLFWILFNERKHGGLTILEWENFYKTQISNELRNKFQKKSQIAHENLKKLERKTPENIKFSLKLTKSEMRTQIENLLRLYFSKFSIIIQNNDMLLLMLLLISILEKKTDNVFGNMANNNRKTTIGIIEKYLN